ncbi:MAG: hypothetical protein HZC22_19260 [Rhodocyclales bacterium]|nr:hypothetical protein [Rhodocyclales bacterium]
MKALFIGTYSCLAAFAVLLGLAAVLSVATPAFHLAWGVVGVLFLVIAAMCLWLVCDCRSEGPGRHA